MKVKQMLHAPSISNGQRFFKLVDNYPNQLNKTDLHYQPYAYINNGWEEETDNNTPTGNNTGTGVQGIMRLSIMNTTFMMMKRMLLRIWSLTKNAIYFVWAVFKFIWSALEFVVLFIKFFFTQKHWTN